MSIQPEGTPVDGLKLPISRLVLGTMTFGDQTPEADAFAQMDMALERGVNFFDTAEMYASPPKPETQGATERVIGRWLKQSGKRDKIVLASKVAGRTRDMRWIRPEDQLDDGQVRVTRAQIDYAVEHSLGRLQTDYIDLYQVHHPDHETPLEETLSTLDDLVRQGKVRYIGASNYPAWLLMKALWISDKYGYARFDSLQPHYSLLHRDEYEREMRAVCDDQGIGVIPYSPLAAGFLTGKYSRDKREADTTRADSGLIKRLLADERAFDVLEAAQEIAAAHGVPVAQVALAWQLAQPALTAPIIGARSVAQLQDLVGTAEVVLTDDEIVQLNDMSQGF